MDEELFGKKLAHYARKKPTYFVQIDGISNAPHYDDYIGPDRDGDMITAQGTVELMDGTSVRVLIPSETNPIEAVRLLKKMAKFLKRKPELMDYAKPKKQEKKPAFDDVPF